MTPISPKFDFEAASKTMEITARNQKESPLLHLPGEIRNRIYEFAVGGHVIVIKSVGSLLRPPPLVQLAMRLAYPSDSTNLKDDIQLSGTNHTPALPPKKSKESVWRIFTIDLVCKQIRSETRLIQYKHNIFQFDNAASFASLTPRLSAAQLNAITEISIEASYIRDLIVSNIMYMGLKPARSFRTSLPNLARFYVDPMAMTILARDTVMAKIGLMWKLLGIRKEKRDDGLIMVLFDALDHKKSIKDAKKYRVRV